MCRLFALSILFVAVDLSGPARGAAAWGPEGIPICSECDASGVLMLPDGAVGAFVAWQRFGGDISLQRVTAGGEIAPGWPADGVAVCAAPEYQALSSIAADGFGGVLVAWDDGRHTGMGGTTGRDIYVQRIQGDGTLAPGWTVDGVPATRAPGRQIEPFIIPDGGGGVFVTWYDETVFDIYAQHLSANGQPAAGWPPNGLPICLDPAPQGAPRIIPDDSGGAIIAWGDLRDGPLSIYGQRMLSDGSIAPGWPTDGARFAFDRGMSQLLADGAGGAFLACGTSGPVSDDDYFLLRITGSGTLAPGWPAGGAVVCQAPDRRGGLRMVPDRTGGVLLAWQDTRDFWEDETLLQRMRGDGSRFPGWPLDGLRVTNNDYFDLVPDLAPDGLGGAYLSWDRYLGPEVQDQIALQHITGSAGVFAGWPVDGRLVPSEYVSFSPRMTEDGMGGAIVAWIRSENGMNNLRALRLAPDGPVAVALSLVSAEAEPGRVRLTWVVAGMTGFKAAVERRTEGGEWERLGEVTADGTGRLSFEDHEVVAGRRYGYRLAYVDEGTERHTGETWVTVPRLELALRGFQPNPSVGRPTVALVLAEAGPATLEAYDVAGRRVASREVGSLGAGRHEVLLAGAERLAAGVYALRLTQGGQVRTARGVVAR
jgi:hypothetical protein